MFQTFSIIMFVTDLNRRLQDFSYSYVDVKDKPTALGLFTLPSSDHSLKQKGNVVMDALFLHYMHMCLSSAAQMWCLCRLLPLMIDQYIMPRNGVSTNKIN